MIWHIDYYNEDLEAKILALPPGLLARYIHLTEIMEEFGPNIGMPHTKSLGSGLLELRLKGKEGIARILYCTLINKRIYMLHCFIKKTEKIPLKELRLAKQRMLEVKRND
jgi:phage-related protein